MTPARCSSHRRRPAGPSRPCRRPGVPHGHAQCREEGGPTCTGHPLGMEFVRSQSSAGGDTRNKGVACPVASESPFSSRRCRPRRRRRAGNVTQHAPQPEHSCCWIAAPQVASCDRRRGRQHATEGTLPTPLDIGVATTLELVDARKAHDQKKAADPPVPLDVRASRGQPAGGNKVDKVVPQATRGGRDGHPTVPSTLLD